MHPFLQTHRLRAAQFFTAALIALACHSGIAVAAHAPDKCPPAPAFAPPALSGMDINLQLEQTKSSLPTGFPTQGVIVKTYLTDGRWSEVGSGGKFHEPAKGSYLYRKTGPATAVEESINGTMNNAPATTLYHFDSPSSGTWKTSWNNNQIQFSGHFTLVPTNLPLSQHLAPQTNAGLHVALTIDSATSSTLPPNSFPNQGLVMQTYGTDGKLVFRGFGAGTINSTGTFSYKKVSANVAVEETIQTTDKFTAPYTMVYTFLTPKTGTWYQDFGGGMIRFNGTFAVFPQ